ncbi:MAG TPA: adenylyl-sulfate kinase [Bryobacteraceae bacterium]|nr:adenylyl-sulfate kinase [Bryobacteraceae bacterium]
MDHKETFAVWITGLPASGKSTVTAALKAKLAARGVDAAVLESDELRKILTIRPRYDEEERDRFYAQMAWIGELLVLHGVPVIFDATANRRVYRDRVRQKIPHFIEVFVDVPLETCIARDPKGIYRSARAGGSATVPGLQAEYEPPEAPEVVVHGDPPEVAAQLIVATLAENGYL